MDRNVNMNEELIDLGTASVETKGNVGPGADFIGQLDQTGIADD